MGLFKRKQERALSRVEVLEPVMEAQPVVKVDELEKMVFDTYTDKLELERKVKELKGTIEHLQEKEIKLQAAETFSRQSEDDRKRLESKIKQLEADKEHLKGQYKQEQAQNATYILKIEQLQSQVKDLTASDAQRMESYRRDIVEELKQLVQETAGSWSKARVIELLTSFQRNNTGEPTYEVEVDEVEEL